MVEQIVGFRLESNLRTFAQLELFLQRHIKLREPRSAQDIPSSITKLTGRWQRKSTRIKPARRTVYSAGVWTNPRVRIADKVRPLGSQQGLQISIVERKHRGKRDIAVGADDSRDLPAAKVASASKRQVVNNIRDKIVPDVEC